MSRHQIVFTCVECGEHTVKRGAARRIKAGCPVCCDDPFGQEWTTHEPDMDEYESVREAW